MLSSSTTLWYHPLAPTQMHHSSEPLLFLLLHQPPSFYGFFPTSIQVLVMSSILKKILFENNLLSQKSWSYLPVPLLAFLFFSFHAKHLDWSFSLFPVASLSFFLEPVSIRLILPAPPTMPLSGRQWLFSAESNGEFLIFILLIHQSSLFLKKLASSDPRTPPLDFLPPLVSFLDSLLVLYLSHQQILESPMAQSLNLSLWLMYTYSLGDLICFRL